MRNKRVPIGLIPPINFVDDEIQSRDVQRRNKGWVVIIRIEDVFSAFHRGMNCQNFTPNFDINTFGVYAN